MAIVKRTTMIPSTETLEGYYLKGKAGKRYFLSVEHDDVVDSPRTSMDNLSHMVCWHRRYDLGDKHSFADTDELTDWLKEQEDQGDKVFCRPLFLLDHSGLSISTHDFNDRWDSGCVGAVYVLKFELEKAGFTFKDNWENVAKGIIEDEVEMYDQYLRGDVWGFRLFEIDGDDLEEVDSCWGFYGDDPHLNGMLDNLGDLEVIPDEKV